jgi:hypothetical protein
MPATWACSTPTTCPTGRAASTITDCYRIGTTHPDGNVVLNAGVYRIPLVAGAKATTIKDGYRVDFPGADTSAYLYTTTNPDQSPSELLEAGTKNTDVLDHNLRELELASSQQMKTVEIADLGDIGGKFAAISYTFQNNEGYSFDGIGVALTDDRGSLEVYVEGPHEGQARNPEVDAIVFLTLIGSQ